MRYEVAVTGIGQTVAFGTQLRRHRRAAGLTQEQVAEQAGISVRAISDLERAVRHTPHRDTVVLLADALGLQNADRTEFEGAARRLRTPAPSGGNNASAVAYPEAAPFVGRQRELMRLEQHLAGHGPPILLLSGEPGIGKTRLLDAAISLAAAGGWRVLLGGCRQSGGQEPYAPLLNALHRHVRAQTAADLRVQLRDCAWLVRMLPELAEGPIPPLPTWITSPEHERRLMVDAVKQFLHNIAGPAGTLLLLDDLQWACQDAFDVLSTLIRSTHDTPVRLIVAFRDTEIVPQAQLSAMVTDLAHAGLVARLSLGPLEAADAARLLDNLLNSDDGASTWRERLLRRVGGVPFYLVSCAQALRDGANRPPEEAPWDVAQSIRQRVEALPSIAREVARAAAVVGRVVERRVLTSMLAVPEEPLLDALEFTCRAGLLEEVGREAYRFTHNIVREVIESDLSAARRASLHQRAANALESIAGTRSIEAIAYHYARSDAVDKALFYLERAGDQAICQFAYTAAADHFRDLSYRLESAGRRFEAGRLNAKLGLLLMRRGRVVDGISAMREVTRAYLGSTEANDLDQTTTAGPAINENRLANEPAIRFETLLSLIEEHEPEATRMVLYLAYAYYFCITSRRPNERLVVTMRAVELARRLHDGDLLARALEARSMALFMCKRRPEAVAVVHEAVALCEASNNLGLMIQLLGVMVQVHVHRGEFADGSIYNERCFELAETVGDRYEAAGAVSRRAWLAKYTGGWKDAKANLARSVQIAPELAHDPWAICMRAELCLVMGDWVEARAYLDLAVAQAVSLNYVPAHVCIQGFLAELDALENRPAAALARALAAIEQDQGEYTPILLTWAAISHLQLGDLDAAKTAADQAVHGASEAEDRLAIPDALRVKALVAIERGEWSSAGQALEEGLALTRSIGSVYAEARLLHTLGLMHARRGDAEPGTARLEEARVLFQRLGARMDAEQVTRDLRTARKTRRRQHLPA